MVASANRLASLMKVRRLVMSFDSRLEVIELLLKTVEVGDPAAKSRYVLSTALRRYSRRLADETLDDAAIAQRHRADTHRRRHIHHELAERAQGQLPHFHGDGCTVAVRGAHEPGFGRRSISERKEPIPRRGVCHVLEPGTRLQQLPVKRLSSQMRSDNCERDAWLLEWQRLEIGRRVGFIVE